MRISDWSSDVCSSDLDAMSAGAGGRDGPALLQTHPVTTMRISDAKARADALIAAQKLRPSDTAMDKLQWEKSTAPIAFVKDPSMLVSRPKSGATDTYALMRERARVLGGEDRKSTRLNSSH